MSEKEFKPFTYRTLDALKQTVKNLNLDIPFNPEVEILQQRIKLHNRYIPNRFAIQPMEGFDAEKDGTPTDLTFRRYKRYAAGGASVIWFEATAIVKEGRSNPHQLMLTEKNKDKFSQLVKETRNLCNSTLKEMGFNAECVLILQLNHSGRYSKKKGKKHPIRAYQNPELDNAINVTSEDGNVISDERLRELEKIWVKKALLAKEAGFDGVDIKACHGYLISDLFDARERLNSAYGGMSFENRTRFYQNIIDSLQKDIKKQEDFIITSRLGVYDGHPFPRGFGVSNDKDEIYPAIMDLTEPLKLIENLYGKGIRLLNISAGDPHYKPFVTRPYDTPVKGKQKPPEHPLIGINRILSLAAQIKKNVPEDMILIGSGYSYLRQYAGYVAAGLLHENKIDICGFGRMAFANPNFPKQILNEGEIDKKKVCITCSKCSALMKEGKSTGCVIRDPKYKGKI